MAALLVVAVGCSSGNKVNGEEKKKPEQVVADAKTALKASKTVHLAGSIKETDASTEGGTSSLDIDLHFLNGTGSYGSLTVSGQRLDIVRVGNDIYAKGDPTLFGSSATNSGKYFKMSATSDSGKQLAGLTELNAFADQLLSPDGKLKATVDRGDVDGKKAVILTDTDPSGPGKLYVANTGKALPLEISGSGASSGKLTFSEYNSDVAVKAPAAGQTVTLPAA